MGKAQGYSYTKLLETFQYLFVERYPYLYKPTVEIKVHNGYIRLVKVKRYWLLDVFFTYMPILGTTFLTVILGASIISAIMIHSRVFHYEHHHLVDSVKVSSVWMLQVTVWIWFMVIVLSGGIGYYLCFIKYRNDVAQGLEALGKMRLGLILDATEVWTKKGTKGKKPTEIWKKNKKGQKRKLSSEIKPASRFLDDIVKVWMWILYLGMPFVNIVIIAMKLDPTKRILDLVWFHIPFLKKVALFFALGSELLFILGETLGRFIFSLGWLYEAGRIGFFFAVLALHGGTGMHDVFRFKMMTIWRFGPRPLIKWYIRIATLFQMSVSLLTEAGLLAIIFATVSILEATYMTVRLHSVLPFGIGNVAFPMLFFTAVAATKLGIDMAVSIHERSLLYLRKVGKKAERIGGFERKVTVRTMKALKPLTIAIGLENNTIGHLTKSFKTLLSAIIIEVTVQVLVTL